MLSWAGDVLGAGAPATHIVETPQGRRYRARFVGFDRTGAEQACLALKGRGQDCMVLKAQ